MNQQLDLLLILRHRSITLRRSTMSHDTPLLPPMTHVSNPIITCLRIPFLILLILNLSTTTLMNTTFLS